MLQKENLQISERQRKIIHKIVRLGKVGTDMCRRLQVVLLASNGMSNYTINKMIGMQKNWIGKWRDRWEQQVEGLRDLESSNQELTDKQLRNHILGILSDKQRAGKPPRISLAQKNQIVAIACEKPEDHGIPVAKWSLALLVKVIKKKKIVDNISVSYVSKVLQKKTAAS